MFGAEFFSDLYLMHKDTKGYYCHQYYIQYFEKNWSSVKQIVLMHTIAMEMDSSLDYFFPQLFHQKFMLCLKGALCVQHVIWSCGVQVVHSD